MLISSVPSSAWRFTLLAASRSPATDSLVCSGDRKSTRLNSSHSQISYAVFCLKKKKKHAPVTETIVTTSKDYKGFVHHSFLIFPGCRASPARLTWMRGRQPLVRSSSHFFWHGT